MKKTISITIDADVWLQARSKVGNMSSYINECLSNLIYKEEEVQESKIHTEIEELKKSILEMSIKLTLKQEQLNKINEIKKEEKKKLEEAEKFKRWVCPVCLLKTPPIKTLNFMDQSKCSNCGLTTRDSKKTVYEYINGVEE